MKKIILFAIIGLTLIGVQAQTKNVMVAELTNGNTFTMPISDIQNITFEDTMVYLYSPSSLDYYSVLLADIKKVYFVTNSSLNEPLVENPVLIYPNPTTNYIKIAGMENSPLTIYTMEGQIVYRGVNNSEKIDVSKLNKGLYIIKIGNKALKFSKL